MMPGARFRIARAILYLFIALWLAPGAALAEWVPRPEAMHWHRLADFDQLDGRVRVLYQTMPSLQQGGQADASINVYIAELYPDGRVENRRLTTGQRRFAALVLRRGHQQVFALPQARTRTDTVPMETWSTADGSVVSTFTAPAITKAATTQRPVAPTGDGNFLITELSAQSSRGDKPTTVTWTKYAPDGSVLTQGEWINPTARVMVAGVFPGHDGAVGLTLDLSVVRGLEALQSDIESNIGFEVGGREIEARVYSETRMLSINAGGHLDWVSPALEREFMWKGDVSIPDDIPMNEILQQNNEQMRLMEQTKLEYAGQRDLVHFAHHGHDEVHLTPGGYGLLAQVRSDHSLEPPQHGTWFIEVGEDGQIIRELRVEPAAERLEAKFERFLPTADGGLLVAGVRRADDTYPHLTALGPEGDIEWTARLQAENLKLEGIGGTKETPWVFGHGYNDAGNKNLMWAELVDPENAERLARATAPATAAQPRPRKTPQPTSPVDIELPEPAEGCSCSCEELARIQEISEQMKSASQADVIAMTTDPAFQALTNCMSGCAMQYAQCR